MLPSHKIPFLHVLMQCDSSVGIVFVKHKFSASLLFKGCSKTAFYQINLFGLASLHDLLGIAEKGITLNQETYDIEDLGKRRKEC